MRSLLAVAPTMLLVLASCGGHAMVTDDPPSSTPYDGPMQLSSVSVGDEEASVEQRSGAAGRALECDGAAFEGGGGSYRSGLASTQDSAEAALEDSFAEDGRGLTLPASGYRVERRADDRVLFSYDVTGRTKIAFIAFDGVEDFNGDTGWGIESWAQCDPSEFPASVTEELNIGVWEDTSGQRVPTDVIQSFHGAEHCGWEDVTFLRLGEGPTGPEYVRDTVGELSSELTGQFEHSGELPASATDTGFRRDGRQLWLSGDRATAYLVQLDDSDDVEVWPASKIRISCA